MSATDYSLLTDHGLPEDAAPFLSFGPRPGLLGGLRSAGQAPERTDHFVEIGTTGSGDPICVDENDGVVYFLNHDAGFAPVLINSSVSSLVQFLELFRDLINQTIAENGSDAYLDGEISARGLDRISEAMRSIDAAALTDGAMWPEQLIAS